MVVFLSPLASIPLMTKEASSFNVFVMWLHRTNCSGTMLLKEAFQNISPRQILFAKLEYYGVRGIALEWFRSYLCNRSQFVMYRDTDLPAVLKHSQCIIFADDTTVYISGINEPVLRQLIEYDLASLTDWFHANKLPLDVLKTNFIWNLSQTSMYDLHLSNNSIHINRITKNIASGSYAIHYVKRFLSMNNMKLLYHSLIHSHLRYNGTMLWSSASQCWLRKLEISSNKCIRNICNIRNIMNILVRCSKNWTNFRIFRGSNWEHLCIILYIVNFHHPNCGMSAHVNQISQLDSRV